VRLVMVFGALAGGWGAWTEAGTEDGRKAASSGLSEGSCAP
jgi:hypothetical protein